MIKSTEISQYKFPNFKERMLEKDDHVWMVVNLCIKPAEIQTYNFDEGKS